MRPARGPAVLFLVFLGAAAPAKTLADPFLPALFTDHMVLQRDSEIRVWGKAEPGEKIDVSLAGIVREAPTDAKGDWTVSLPARAAGGPFTLEVRGDKTIRIKDVMIGEVWIASGQSNMTFSLAESSDAEKEIALADFPRVRLFTVPEKTALSPQTDAPSAAWRVCTPETARKFSAVAYHFARKLHESLGVPVGLILSGWPGTSIEEWMDARSLRSDPRFQPALSAWAAAAPETKAFAREGAPFDLEFDGFELLPASSGAAPKALSAFDAPPSTGFPAGYWSYSWEDAPQTSFETSRPGHASAGETAARVSGRLDTATSSRLKSDFRIDSAPADLSAYSGIRFWARGRGSFRLQTLQPTISDWDNYETPDFPAGPDWKPFTVRFADLRQEDWGVHRPLTLQALTAFQLVSLAPVASQDRPPSGLYDGMIAPLTPYRIRGALWYQGEGNADRGELYRSLLPAMIDGWRKDWGEGDFPVLIVQLPFIGPKDDPTEPLWAELRDAQLRTAKAVPNAGLAVIIDLGDAENVHPHRKKEVGERLALWALGTTYGQKIVYSGPIEDSARIDGGLIRVRFTHTGSGLKGESKGFTIAGADRKFHQAVARVHADEVEVSSPDVPTPVAVRYDWANNPDGDLSNAEGLPASPFRTDDWPFAAPQARP